MQPYPLHPRYVGHIADEVGNVPLAVNVQSIKGQLLSYHLKLADSIFHQPSHLSQDIFLRAALVAARDDGNGAVGTIPVAALADLHVGIVAGSSQRAHTGTRRYLLFAQVSQQLHVVELAVVAIHLWNLALQVVHVTL